MKRSESIFFFFADTCANEINERAYIVRYMTYQLMYLFILSCIPRVQFANRLCFAVHIVLSCIFGADHNLWYIQKIFAPDESDRMSDEIRFRPTELGNLQASRVHE